MKMPQALRRVWDWSAIAGTIPLGWQASHIIWSARETGLAILTGAIFLACFLELLERRLNRDIALELAK